MTVTGRESACKQLCKVNLGASGCKGIEVKVMNMDIALGMSLSKCRVKDIHLIEFLSAAGAVFKHGTHSGITIDIGVFTLNIAVLGRGESQILIDLHDLCVHLTHSGSVCAVKDVCLCCGCVTLFDEDFFNSILNLFYRRNLILFGAFDIIADSSRDFKGFVIVRAAH